ncbi:MAG TPA: methyltransferase domain-containing protein, partial [Acidimicrobiales bacterium]|nr:methyltransferase domain-containing protein [Acidimicrobiales bacterium]
MTAETRDGPGAQSGRPSPAPGAPGVTGLARRVAGKGRSLLSRVTHWRDPIVVDAGYRAVLQRRPDPWGRRDFLGRFRSGELTVEQFGRVLLDSPEFERVRATRNLVHSLHHSRCAFVRSLPPARRILDLGGTNLQHEHGAMVTMGYPYVFDELVIVDLLPEERHPLYNRGGLRSDVESRQGRITYAYHSMADLSRYPDESFDLVYSGQSIEHVPVDVADVVLSEAYRVLRRDGLLALDTPNARVTRLQQAEFIDPDHKYEYTPEELEGKIRRAGFEVLERKGLNLGLRSMEEGRFDEAEVAENVGVF